MSMASFIL